MNIRRSDSAFPTRQSYIELDESDYDPHVHRKIAHPTTYGDAMMHLLKGSIGAGVLAMPDAIMRVGIIYGVIGLFFISLMAIYCVQLLIKTQYIICKRKKRGYMAYPKSMSAAIRYGPECMHWSAPIFYTLVNTMLVIWQLGICAVYFVFFAVNISQVLSYYGTEIPVRLLIVYTLPPQILLNLIKNLKMLTPLSSISNLITILAMLLVFFYLIEDDLEIKDEFFKLKELHDIPVFVGITLFGLEAVGVVLAIEYHMEKPKEFTGICGLYSIGMVIIVGLFLLLGVAGYLKYGSEIRGSITLNLPQEQKKAQAAKVCFATALFFSFPLQNFVAYEITWRRTQKRFNPTNTFFWDYSLRVILVLIPFVMALAAPNLSACIALLGALCLSLIAIVFPAIMDMSLCYQKGYGRMHYKFFRGLFIIVFGLVCLVSGVYTSILEILHGEGD